MLHHKNLQVRCSPDQPIELLIDKLSSKSTQLYIFWQNYNQIYRAYHQKCNQIQRLLKQNQILRQQKSVVKVMSPPPQQIFYKQRYITLEKSTHQLQQQMQRLRMQNKQYKKTIKRLQQQNNQLQGLLHQLRQQNHIQRNNIENILNQLRHAQGQINQMSKIYDQVAQKDILIQRLVQNQKVLLEQIAERQEEIQIINFQSKQLKNQYQKIIRQSMNNAKNRVLQSLPNLIQTSKHRVQIIGS